MSSCVTQTRTRTWGRCCGVCPAVCNVGAFLWWCFGLLAGTVCGICELKKRLPITRFKRKVKSSLCWVSMTFFSHVIISIRVRFLRGSWSVLISMKLFYLAISAVPTKGSSLFKTQLSEKRPEQGELTTPLPVSLRVPVWYRTGLKLLLLLVPTNLTDCLQRKSGQTCTRSVGGMHKLSRF